MEARARVRRFLMGVGVISLLSLSSVSANTTAVFQEEASGVMFERLQSQGKRGFLEKFYETMLFIPVWTEEQSLSPFATELFDQITTDKTLPHTSKLFTRMQSLQRDAQAVYGDTHSVERKVALEFAIAKLYKDYSEYLIYGSINWGAFQSRLYNLKGRAVNAAWVTYKPKLSPIEAMEQAVLSGSLERVLAEATPQRYHYEALEQSLVNYLKIQEQGGWSPITPKRRLKLGREDDAIVDLRERLRMTADYQGCETNETTRYDSCLKEAVIHFQKRHGLLAKGVVDKKTLTALNLPVAERIKQIRLNLDRIKWLNTHEDSHHIMINIPSFTLFFEANGTLIQQMRVITGKPKNPTPIFSNCVETIVLNPHWNVPRSIIQKEMIPKLIKNPNAMARRGIEIRTGWGSNSQKVDASTIDWSQYRYSRAMPFRFAQVPGSRNALGKVKFLFPNRFSVYMHDTPNKRLFKRQVRAFSHGCIRLSQPRELLKTFSTFNKSVDFKKSQRRLRGTHKAYLKLDHQVPVDVVYLTAYIDYDGVLQFRDDIYGYDKMQLQGFRSW